ncbi:MAG: hypothetical protein ACFFB2_11270 [Promethearchaeota archaeon]
MEARPILFFQICLFSYTLFLFIGSVTGSDSVFQGEVLGHLGDFGIAGVSPPNYTNYTISYQHYDVAGYDTVIFRLGFSGEIPVEITHLDVTQEITAFSQTWNYSHGSVDFFSPLTLVSGGSATFQVTGSPYFIEGGLFHVKITTANLGIYWPSFSSEGISKSLPDWPLTTSPSINATNSFPRWLYFFPLFCVFILLSRQRTRNKLN